MSNTSSLYPIPDSWKWTTIGEMFSVKGGKRLPKGYSYTSENTRLYYIRVTDFNNLTIDTTDLHCISAETQRKISRYTISKDDVYISIAGSIGKVGVIPGFLDGANLTENAAKITDIHNYNNKLLAFFLTSQFAQSQITKLVTSSNQPKLALFRIKKILIPLIPLPEQERIVAKIEELFTQLDAGLAELQQAKAQLKRYRQAVLKAAVEGELTREWREEHQEELEPASELLERILRERREKWEQEELAKLREKGKEPKDDKWKAKYKEPALPNTDGLPELPEGWVWANTGSLCDCIVPNRDKPKSFSGETPWITLPDFNKNGIYIGTSKSNLGLTPDEVIRYKAKIIPEGSVVMSCVGRFGITGVVERDLVVNQQLHAFLIPEEVLDSKFLAYAIKTQVPFMEQVATATTITYMNKSKCNSVPVPLPPINEQKRIVEKIERRLSVANGIEQEFDQALARAEGLRQSILKRAFEGKLVEQRPEDSDARRLVRND